MGRLVDVSKEKVTIHLKSSLRTKEISTLTVVLLVFLLRLSALISTDSPLLYCYLTYITSSSIYTGEKRRHVKYRVMIMLFCDDTNE